MLSFCLFLHLPFILEEANVPWADMVVRGQLSGVSPLLPPLQFRGLNSGHQAYKHLYRLSRLTDPSPRPFYPSITINSTASLLSDGGLQSHNLFPTSANSKQVCN